MQPYVGLQKFFKGIYTISGGLQVVVMVAEKWLGLDQLWVMCKLCSKKEKISPLSYTLV